jgi:hypothetical protein|eukprot:jgi/Chrpa1/3215/Chrysochromulina_OHIO_Genome00014639-RA
MSLSRPTIEIAVLMPAALLLAVGRCLYLYGSRPQRIVPYEIAPLSDDPSTSKSPCTHMYCMDSAEDPELQPAGQRETSEPRGLPQPNGSGEPPTTT